MPPIPDPPRPLTQHGAALWKQYVHKGVDRDDLLAVCELLDERFALRGRYLRTGEPSDQKLLRAVDDQYQEQLRTVKRAASWAAT